VHSRRPDRRASARRHGQPASRDRPPDACPPSSEGGRPPGHGPGGRHFSECNKPGPCIGDPTNRPLRRTGGGKAASRRFGDGRSAGLGDPLFGGRHVLASRAPPATPSGAGSEARAPQPCSTAASQRSRRRLSSERHRTASGRPPDRERDPTRELVFGPGTAAVKPFGPERKRRAEGSGPLFGAAPSQQRHRRSRAPSSEDAERRRAAPATTFAFGREHEPAR
jgi:hypothetical protein